VCYCSDALQYSNGPLQEAAESACNIPCASNTLEFCGGVDTISIYQQRATSSEKLQASVKALVRPKDISLNSITKRLVNAALMVGDTHYVSIGCYTNLLGGLNLLSLILVPQLNLTVEICLQICYSQLIIPKYAGVENGV